MKFSRYLKHCQFGLLGGLFLALLLLNGPAQAAVLSAGPSPASPDVSQGEEPHAERVLHSLRPAQDELVGAERLNFRPIHAMEWFGLLNMLVPPAHGARWPLPFPVSPSHAPYP